MCDTTSLIARRKSASTSRAEKFIPATLACAVMDQFAARTNKLMSLKILQPMSTARRFPPPWTRIREQGFAALSKFRRQKRHCLPSRHHLEGKFKLGRWVSTQRYLKDTLSVERRKRLDRIGFVWNWRDYLWEQGFAALLTFKRREGHCRVPIQHREGNFRLGYWVSTQRRKRTELPALRKRRLNKIGFVWREGRGYRRAMEIKDAL